MEPMFEIPNETAKEEAQRLKGVTRKHLEDTLALTIERVKQRERQLPLDVTVQCRALSTNKMSGRRKTYETKEYLSYRDLIARKFGGHYGIQPNQKFRLRIEVGFSNRASDLDNVMKPLLDSMTASMDDDFDDKQIYEIVAHKRLVKKGQEYIRVKMSLIPESEYKSWWA